MAGIPIITGFDLAAAQPIDSRLVVSDATVRDSIVWKYAGLLVYQLDVASYFYYDGLTWQPVAFGGTPGTDGSVWHSGTGAPAGALGAEGDYYLETITGDVYNKTGPTTWVVVANIKGPQGDSGAEPAYGSLYVHQASSPQNITTTPQLVTQFPNAGASNGGVVPSAGSSQIVIGNSGDYALFLNANVIGTGGATTYEIGIFVNGVSTLAAVTFEVGGSVSEVVSFETVVNVPAGAVLTLQAKHFGAGSIALTFITGTWGTFGVNAKGDRGKALIHTEHDIVLNEAKITAITAGTWTPEDPYSASVISDTRADLSTPIPLSGNKLGHSISYNGTNWFDNGIWRGPQGTPGAPGAPGASGVNATGGTKFKQGTYNFNTEAVGTKTIPGFTTVFAKAYLGVSFVTPLESVWKPKIEFTTQCKGDNPAVEDLVRYVVQRSADGGSTYTTLLGPWDFRAGDSYRTTVQISYIDNTAMPSTTYMYRLVGYNSATENNWFSSGFGYCFSLVPG